VLREAEITLNIVLKVTTDITSDCSNIV